MIQMCLYYKPCFFVIAVLGLNLLGRDVIMALEISVDDFLSSRALAINESSKVDLRTACSKLCDEYTELFQPALGCLRDVELEIELSTKLRQYS